ncbi:SLC13 family permease [Nonomuraea sp. NPDC050328]|uniref:SLC13 family permease n=1 Tax=Nonomuraea sp. NPDC050328 TaxID=3364361 RepID=UPI00379A0D2B
MGWLDRTAAAVLALGVLALLTGLLPLERVVESLDGVVPTLVFLAALVVLAELARRAQVFELVAARLTVVARGNYVVLFLLCTAFAALTTVFLNLETTAVLVTPVLLALAARAGISPLPLAMTTVWLAGTAGLLLPVSNLTNLLAGDRLHVSAGEFAARMWLPEAVAAGVTMVFLWVFHWRLRQRGEPRYVPPEAERAKDRVLTAVAWVACAGFAVAVLLDVEPWLAACGAAALLVVAFVVRDRAALGWGLLPWRLPAFVTGLVLIVATLGEYGLAGAMAEVTAAEPYRTAAVGAVLANLVNAVPAYLATQTAIPVTEPDLVFALLIGTNAGALVTPWASLSTLLWLETCARHGVLVPMTRFVLTGAGLALVAVAAATWTLVGTA